MLQRFNRPFRFAQYLRHFSVREPIHKLEDNHLLLIPGQMTEAPCQLLLSKLSFEDIAGAPLSGKQLFLRGRSGRLGRLRK